MNYMGNYPDNFSQKAFDAYWGPSLSSAAEDALEQHPPIQTLMMQLRAAIEARLDVMGFSIYEELLGAIQDAERTDAQLHEIVADEDAQRAEDEKAEALERRWEERREERDW